MTRRSCWRMRQRNLMIDTVEKNHSIYDGKLWNRYIKDYQTWNTYEKWVERFDQFCRRMWLDNEDENLTLAASGNRLPCNEYINKNEDFLYRKFMEKDRSE